MAIITPTVTTVKKNTRQVIWVGATADTFLPYTLKGPAAIYLSLQVSGGALTATGSLTRGGAQDALKDNENVDISLADTEMSEILNRPLQITPIPVGVTVTTILTISY